MSAPRVGSLCSGYGGLSLAVEQFFGAETAWFSEFDPAPSKVLAAHWPGVPNLGDMTKINWASVEPVGIIEGGTPCQDLSGAGRRKGMTEGTRSNLWVQMREAIAVIRPSLVVWENVEGAFSARAASEVESEPGLLGVHGPDRPALRALGRVLGDLSELGYDTEWVGLRASDAGAPHRRFRVFVLASDASGVRGREGDIPTRLSAEGDDRATVSHESDPRRVRVDLVADSLRVGFGEHAGEPSAEEAWTHTGHELADHHGVRPATEWGPYRPAIERWERVLGRFAPAPTERSVKGSQRLSPRFVEWMMGAPEGWVTDPAIGLTRNQELKALGNGVVTQQALLALSILWPRVTAELEVAS